MKAFEVPEIVINRLKYLARNYDGITHLLVSSKNRLQSINPDSKTDFDDTCQELDRIKNKHTRMLEKELEYWDVWLKWLVNVPGIGPWIGAELILALFYRFPAVCKKCGTLLEKKDKSFWCSHCKKSVKGDGILNYIWAVLWKMGKCQNDKKGCNRIGRQNAGPLDSIFTNHLSNRIADINTGRSMMSEKHIDKRRTQARRRAIGTIWQATKRQSFFLLIISLWHTRSRVYRFLSRMQIPSWATPDM